MNLASLSGVADFGAKADFFTWNSALAGLAFLTMAIWMRPSIGRVFGRRDLAFVAAVLVIPFIVIAGALRLNLVALVATSVLLIAAGFIERRWSPVAGAEAGPPPGASSPAEVWSARAAVAGILGVAIFNAVDDRLWIHYDYFSQSIAAIDLGVNGRSPSAWMMTFDPSRWFVVSQGIMPVLDAVEVLVNGTVTTTLSQWLLLVLMVLVIRAAPRRALNYLVLVVVLGMYLIDYNRAPRPHVFVGILGGLFLLRLHAGARWRELAVYLALLALAKRDGLVLAVLIGSVYFVGYIRLRFGWRVVAGVSAALLVGVALLLNSWVALWSRTPLEALIFALTRAGYGELIQKPEVAQSLVAGLIVIGVMVFNRVRPGVLVIPAIFTAYVVITAATVNGVGSYNFGTILRKLFFMLAPVLLCGVLIARSHPAADREMAEAAPR